MRMPATATNTAQTVNIQILTASFVLETLAEIALIENLN